MHLRKVVERILLLEDNGLLISCHTNEDLILEMVKTIAAVLLVGHQKQALIEITGKHHQRYT